ncbi:S8 family peptidase [Longimicrobium sp.]|uniref:S8 family peptidase n=1 Tax=Longimicrobium sp. TaxID=2029185 RepID=UPI002E374C28|nr:S8 family peptidase [Longimicrobium sp.]HEX6042791.1 S8 family peptidase [Longimicrobium sp.]
MRSIPFALFAALALAACADGPSPVAGIPADAAPLLNAAPGRALDGRYVVVLRDGADPRAVAAVAGVHPRHVYTAALTGFAAALTGFAAALNAGQLAALRHHPHVAYVEQDQSAGGVQPLAVQAAPPWGLDRINQRALPLDGNTGVLPTASTVYAYVIDTGIQTGATGFGGRASVAYDALGGNGQDCNGHGTAVAGIIGSSTYGVAKGVRLRAVRVLDCNGGGSVSGIIAGVDWVRVNHVDPAVANLSLSGALSSALNTAVGGLAGAGVFVAVQAGDNNASACNYSPASATAAVTVAASTITDARWSFGNVGSCVDLYAPGVNIPSIGGTFTGTGFATPHVTGAAALYKSGNPAASTATVTAWLKNNATPNVITGNPAGTPNLLLFIGTL